MINILNQKTVVCELSRLKIVDQVTEAFPTSEKLTNLLHEELNVELYADMYIELNQCLSDKHTPTSR